MKKLIFRVALIGLLFAAPGVANATSEASPSVILAEVSKQTGLSYNGLMERHQAGFITIDDIGDTILVSISDGQGGTSIIEILDSF